MAPLAGVGINHKWIYSLIWDDKACGGDLWRHLRQPKRRSGYLLSARLSKISAELTKVAMIRLLKPRLGAVQTITLDNGSEFADHVAVAKAVTTATYFCAPYYSGQRGTNENTNGLIRQYFSQGNRLPTGHRYRASQSGQEAE